ncbi:hypothetical protein ACJ72_05439 [Emergomyces africanus]|uniref:arginine--tRNA ligase n=1 Tax=Emergomyces africanus TaxID=1955775 RepID=A0A1B7NTX4_9EURO|nr:hypothetical protein ACJ72_05439 [Emergomyces africanus]
MQEVMRASEANYVQVADPEAVADVVGIYHSSYGAGYEWERINNCPFDVTRMTSLEGGKGPYLQYSHARLCSITRKAQLTPDQVAKADFTLLKPHAMDILRLMAQYPDITSQAFKTLEPTTILTYLFRLTHQVSSAHDVSKVLGTDEGPEVMLARSVLYEGSCQVLENGMRLLGRILLEKFPLKG